MKTANDMAHKLATKYARGTWWVGTPILSRHDPRIEEGKTAPAAWCGVCQTVFTEFPNSKRPSISAGAAAPAHIKDAHPVIWNVFIDQAHLAIRTAGIWWAGRRSLPRELRPKLVENPLDKRWMNFHMPCPAGCGTTLHEHFATDQVTSKAKLTFSKDVVDACILRMAEHLMRHSKDKLRTISEAPIN